ncbi:hypothetical protein O181_005915 [Austropuccinia psidii MF-1]|uniref:Uncharacterized protein n=1 Tax=Austropuccinia psidii MF-1 TaxID=1389203 RepID=A0A9Q3BJX0_9BASI|nr:hypothetical protein [Austropuccinia psidii MF-1]
MSPQHSNGYLECVRARHHCCRSHAMRHHGIYCGLLRNNKDLWPSGKALAFDIGAVFDSERSSVQSRPGSLGLRPDYFSVGCASSYLFYRSSQQGRYPQPQISM